MIVVNLDLTRTITFLELLWTAVAVIGILVLTVNGLAAHGDLRRLRQLGLNSVRTLIALDNRRTEWVLWCALIVYALAGSRAMFRPSPLISNTATLDNLIPHLFLFTEVLMVWSSIARRLTRRQVIQMLEARQKEK